MMGSGEKILVAVLVGCTVLFGAGITIGLLGEDRNAPVITVSEVEDFVYAQDTEDPRLLEGVTAADKEDGDVTESIIVSDITYINDSECVVVYAAKDDSDNVATYSRKLEYIHKGEGKDTYYNNLRKHQIDNQKPYLRLLVHGAYVIKGTTLSFPDYIMEAIDASGNDLRGSLQIEGVYDFNVPGVYEVELFVTDIAGRDSNVEVFEIIVE